MRQEERRARILALLSETDGPVTGSALSSLFGVTRQVIVGDVAVLRAQGAEIIATPQGYLLPKPSAAGVRSRLAVRHGPEREALAQELNLIVDAGGTVVDVSVEHPLYGELTANLQLSTRGDVQRFMDKMEELQGEPLLVLTGGYHLHTIEAPNPKVMEGIKEALRAAGFLME
ncbi:MAG TPA: transcription repressor NadR [Limnochordia bacterium]|nr:transcription repressor NadR [Limnochordia bacterium]